MSTTTAPAPQHTAETIVETFSNGDCWHLAHVLASRYTNLTVATFGLEDDPGDLDWFHMFVHDDRTDTYLDINGVQTPHEIMDRWDLPCFEWDEILHLTISECEDRIKYNERWYPEVPVEAGIAHLVAKGWTPPPLREN